MAGLAALAAAFAAFAVPQELLSNIVSATGLPSLIAAAQPPLGLTARVAIAVGGAVFVFGVVFLLLRLLDRSGMSAAPETPDRDEEEAPAPRVRRRDGHPDAPAPRPISAARDLGEPAPPQAPRAAVPLWLDEAEPAAAPVVEEPEAVIEPEPEPEPVLELRAELEAEPAPPPEPQPPLAIWQAPEPVLAEPMIVSEPEPAPQPEPEPAPQAELPTSIAELMDRLERGLAQRRPVAPAPAPPVAPQVFPEAAEPPDDRLQNAIASLQRLAARSS